MSACVREPCVATRIAVAVGIPTVETHVRRSSAVLNHGMGTSSPLARAVALDRDAAPVSLAKPAAWAFVVACGLAAIYGAFTLYAAERSFSPFGLETFALGTVAKSSFHYGSKIAADVLLALAAGLMHFRSAACASPKVSRSLALRITGLLPVFAAACIACFAGSAVLLSHDGFTAGQFIDSADFVAAAVLVLFRMALLGSILLVAAPLLRKQGGKLMLVGKVALLWLIQGLLWIVLEWSVRELLPP